MGSSVLFTIALHLPRLGCWPVRKRVRLTRSCLGREASSDSLSSLLYTSRNLSCLSGSCLTPLLIRAILAAASTGTAAWSIRPPSSANLSASSLPPTPQWPGTHSSVILRSSASNLQILSLSRTSLRSTPSPYSASTRERLSVTRATDLHSSASSSSHLTASVSAVSSAP